MDVVAADASATRAALSLPQAMPRVIARTAIPYIAPTTSFSKTELMKNHKALEEALLLGTVAYTLYKVWSKQK